MSTPYIAVIPARLASTRLPRKPLADIGGAPMVVRVAQQAAKSKASRILVATDSEEIVDVCKSYSIEALLTSANHPSGTDRLSEVVQMLQLSKDEIFFQELLLISTTLRAMEMSYSRQLK